MDKMWVPVDKGKYNLYPARCSVNSFVVLVLSEINLDCFTILKIELKCDVWSHIDKNNLKTL